MGIPIRWPILCLSPRRSLSYNVGATSCRRDAHRRTERERPHSHTSSNPNSDNISAREPRWRLFLRSQSVLPYQLDQPSFSFFPKTKKFPVHPSPFKSCHPAGSSLSYFLPHEAAGPSFHQLTIHLYSNLTCRSGHKKKTYTRFSKRFGSESLVSTSVLSSYSSKCSSNGTTIIYQPAHNVCRQITSRLGTRYV